MSVQVKPDLKKAPRVRDALLLRELHLHGVVCVLCGKPGSLHHVYPRGQGGDDVRGNLLGLCGDGTTGHHGLTESHDPETLTAVGTVIVTARTDVVGYMVGKLGEEAGREWLNRRFSTDV